MPRTSASQRRTTGRVMHEFKHGELKSGPRGKGGKVRSRRQAIAIALKESGTSKYESPRENKRNLAKTKRKEAAGKTYQQEHEGRSHVGSRGKRDSTPAMRTRTTRKPAGRSRKAAASRTATRRRATKR